MLPVRVPLIQSPTPLHRLDRASAQLGLDLWIKRDDLTGFALGGNKGRKLEYLIADALQVKAEVVVTCGSTQSNFIRQLGAACAVYGLQCVSAAMELPYEHVPSTPVLRPGEGNVLVDRILGVELRLFANGTWTELYAHAEDVAKELESAGKTVYRVPIGGSSPLGAYAFYRAAEELHDQGPPFDWVVTASSSGSTQTGLAYAFNGSSTRVLGIVSDPEPEIVDDFEALGNELGALIGGSEMLTSKDFLIDTGFVGPGYGTPSEEGDEALRWLANTEGVFLDPIYSAKAFAGLTAWARSGRLSGRVLFWHTGGVPALFAHPRWAGPQL